MDTLKLRSSIRAPLMQFILIRGTVLAAIGACFLLSALFLPVETLKIWGLPILCMAGILISVGLCPYRRLCRLERQPNELSAVENNTLHFSMHGKPIFTIPFHSIDRIAYIEQGQLYGIGLWIKQSPPEKIIVHDRKFDIQRYTVRSQKKHHCDLFLQYFSRYAFDQLMQHQTMEEE